MGNRREWGWGTVAGKEIGTYAVSEEERVGGGCGGGGDVTR